MDLKQGIKSEVDSGKGSDDIDSNQSASMHMKSCTDCRTTRTPLWRGGPEGPKTLCNACGIKYNKKRRELLGLDTVSRKEKGKKKQKSTTAAESSRSRRSSEMSQSYRVKLTTALGGEKMFRRLKKKLGGNLKEEEHAAILLMALSCGSVYG